jgi:DNA-binding NtrC family response regulator
VSNILCVDDDPGVLVVLEQSLAALGHTTTLLSSVSEAIAELGRQSFDLVLTDYRMPGETGLDLVHHTTENGIDVPVIVMTGYFSVENAVASMKEGAVDYLTKPLRAEALRIAVNHAIEIHRLRRTNDAIRRELSQLRGERTIVGNSRAIREVMETIASVAPTRATVLLEGESGTGKELFARAIHEQSPRRDGPFITVNCAALPEGLVESAMFGHERGAFTGATSRSAGAFERAHGGTLLLDEISEMRLDLQAKLLRAIQEQEIERVGGNQVLKVDVRIIATTNRNLLAEAEAGRFRHDLYYRIHVMPIRTPPLREHLEDVPELVEHFVAQISLRLGVRPPAVPAETLDVLRGRRWQGNVRELANVIERGVILQRNGRLHLASLVGVPPIGEPEPSMAPASALAAAGGVPHAVPAGGIAESQAEGLNLRELERLAIERALVATGGHRTRAAKLLGISERTLRNKLNPRPTIAEE